MTLTIELTPQQERRLRLYADRQKLPVENALEEWLDTLPEEIPTRNFATDEEFEQFFDDLAEIGKGKGYLPESAFDRENIYEDRL